MKTPLDPATLRAMAAELDEGAERMRRCCGGTHTHHRERLAMYVWLANDYRSAAIGAELDAARRDR